MLVKPVGGTTVTFDGVVEFFRRSLRAEPRDDLARLVDREFGEIHGILHHLLRQLWLPSAIDTAHGRLIH